MIYEFSTPPCHSEERSDEDELLRTLSEKSRVHPLIRLRYVLEILPPFGRLDDRERIVVQDDKGC